MGDLVVSSNRATKTFVPQNTIVPLIGTPQNRVPTILGNRHVGPVGWIYGIQGAGLDF